MNSRQFVELISDHNNEETSSSSTASSTRTESWWLWSTRPVVRNFIVGEERFDKIPAREADDVIRFVLFCT